MGNCFYLCYEAIMHDMQNEHNFIQIFFLKIIQAAIQVSYWLP